MSKFVVAKPKPIAVCPAPKARQLTELLTHWTWLDIRPISIVNDRGLKNFVAFLEPGYTMPSHTHVAHKLRLKHSEGGAQLQRIIAKEADSVSLTTDAWTSRACQSYTTTTAHFIADERKLQRSWKSFTFQARTRRSEAEKLVAAVDRFDVDHTKVEAVVLPPSPLDHYR